MGQNKFKRLKVNESEAISRTDKIRKYQAQRRTETVITKTHTPHKKIKHTPGCNGRYFTSYNQG